MRYRALDQNGDSTFGSGSTAFFVNNAQAVAQAVETRLLLMTGEWFLDVTEGTPYSTQIIGKTTQTYDQAIRDRILGTEGVVSLVTYSSQLNRATRFLTVNAVVQTVYGPVPVIVPIPIPVPPFDYAVTDYGTTGVTDDGNTIVAD